MFCHQGEVARRLMMKEKEEEGAAESWKNIVPLNGRPNIMYWFDHDDYNKNVISPSWQNDNFAEAVMASLSGQWIHFL